MVMTAYFQICIKKCLRKYFQAKAVLLATFCTCASRPLDWHKSPFVRVNSMQFCNLRLTGGGHNTDPQSMDYPKMDYADEV